MSGAIVTRGDLRRYLEDHGLALVHLDDRDAPVRLVVREAVSADSVVRHQPVDVRVEELRRALRERGAIGVRWRVVLHTGAGPYRTPGGGG